MAPNKLNINERLTDGEIDLSMSDLQDVPVKEIVPFRKVYALDLSNNRLTTLPKNFSTLTQLTKLDLSKNELKELPENFGDLVKLKYLDLYHNQLQHLPLSFSKLKDLRWLDLKDNPLVPTVAKVAGPCLDTKQCQVCAKDVVNFFVQLQKQVNSELEVRHKQRQKQIEMNQQKKQEDKKSKKKEKTKQKQVVPPNQEKNLKEQKKKRKVSNDRNQNDVSKQSSCVLKTLFFSLVAGSMILFVLTSIKVKHTEDVELLVQNVYGKSVESLPDNLKTYGVQMGSLVRDVHVKTGNLTNNVIDFFKTNQDWKHVCDVISSFIGTTVNKIQELYVKIVK